MLDKELLEQFQLLTGMMEKMDTRIGGMESKIDHLESKMLTKDDIEPLTDRSASKVAALMETRIGKRLDALTDGYKLTHEKQYELERRVDKLEQLIADLQNRIA